MIMLIYNNNNSNNSNNSGDNSNNGNNSNNHSNQYLMCISSCGSSPLSVFSHEKSLLNISK